MTPLSPEAVAQMVDTLKDRRASWLGDGSSPDKLCADAADMLTTLSAENATLRAKHNGTYQPKHPFRGGKRPAVTPWRE